MRKFYLVLASILVLGLGLSACEGSSSNEDKAAATVNEKAEGRSPYLPVNDVEFKNYNEAQKLYDSPDTIIWCSVMPQASSAPILTVPVTGKLTSSSTTFFAPETIHWNENAGGTTTTSRSVDGLYHPNPPQYRYGFTPGGQYVDFYSLPTFCTTKPLDFQKDSIAVKIDPGLNSATKQAEAALAAGDNAKAQEILEGASGE